MGTKTKVPILVREGGTGICQCLCDICFIKKFPTKLIKSKYVYLSYFFFKLLTTIYIHHTGNYSKKFRQQLYGSYSSNLKTFDN